MAPEVISNHTPLLLPVSSFFGHREFSYGEEGSLTINITTSFPHVHNYLCKHQMTACLKKGLKSLLQVQ